MPLIRTELAEPLPRHNLGGVMADGYVQQPLPARTEVLPAALPLRSSFDSRIASGGT